MFFHWKKVVVYFCMLFHTYVALYTKSISEFSILILAVSIDVGP